LGVLRVKGRETVQPASRCLYPTTLEISFTVLPTIKNSSEKPTYGADGGGLTICAEKVIPMAGFRRGNTAIL